MSTRRLFGLPVSTRTLKQTTAHVLRQVENGTPCRIVALNTNKLYQMEQNPLLRESVENADLLLPDGMSIVWASRLLPGPPIPERVTGIDLFRNLLEKSEKRGFRPFFFGAREAVLDEMRSRLEQLYPDLDVAGARNGYFDREELPKIIDQINASNADLLFIGISSPLKEEIMEAFGDRLEVPVVQGVGGSFDVLAGDVRRAPDWVQAAGMEWAYRLMKEPGRLWKRYLYSNSYFAWRLLRELFSRDG